MHKVHIDEYILGSKYSIVKEVASSCGYQIGY